MRSNSGGLLTIVTLCCCQAAWCGNVRPFAGIMAGYDSNPAQTHSPTGTAFADYAVGVEGETQLRAGALALSLNARYRDYDAVGDNHRTSMLATWSGEANEGIDLISLSLEASRYRDFLVPADERDEAGFALSWSRPLGTRDDLSLEAGLRWLAYRNASLLWQGRPGATTAGKGRRRGGGEDAPAAVRRTDRIASLDLEGIHYWTPSIATVTDLYIARRDSPVRLEAYDHLGAGLALRLTPADGWRLEIALDGSARRYDQGPKRLERQDERLGASLLLMRKTDAGDLSCGLEMLDNSSSVESKSFHQWVGHCGLFRTF